MEHYLLAIKNHELTIKKHRNGQVTDEQLNLSKIRLQELRDAVVNETRDLLNVPVRRNGPRSKTEEERKHRRAAAQRRYQQKVRENQSN
jgi:hypothetical protein